MVDESATASRAPKLDPELQKIDKIAERWARDREEYMKLHPLELMRLLHDGAVFGNVVGADSDAELIAFDEAYLKADRTTKRVLAQWYLTGGSSDQKAFRLGMSRSRLYEHWKGALKYFRGFLRGRGLNV